MKLTATMIDLRILCEDYDFSPLAAAFSDEFDCDVPAAVEVEIVTEEEIKRLNGSFRNIDEVTDVLSFPSLEGIYGKSISAKNFPYDVDDGVLAVGSIAVCKEVAVRQAEEYGHSFERELNYLITHGICHLFGYDHIDEGDRAAMREKEEKVLKKLLLTR